MKTTPKKGSVNNFSGATMSRHLLTTLPSLFKINITLGLVKYPDTPNWQHGTTCQICHLFLKLDFLKVFHYYKESFPLHI